MRLPALDLPWTQCPIAVLDLETTAANPTTAVPVEVAVARFEGGELVGSWSTLLNPGTVIPPDVIGIHGITDLMVANAPRAADVVALMLRSDGPINPGALELLRGAYPCGYNGLHYDRPILQRLANERSAGWQHAIAWLACPWLDPLVYIRDIDGLVKGERGRHKLTAACERRGIVHERAHRALGDCIATGKLLWAMRDEINRRGELTLGQLVRRTVARAGVQTRDLDRYWGRGKVHGGSDVA